MARYLVRLANEKGFTPEQTRSAAQRIREVLGSKDSIGHLRISSLAIEFDLFAKDDIELNLRKRTLEEKVASLLTLKALDLPPVPRGKIEVLREGIGLFNEERFWECHEVLEQVWHPATGIERNIIQGLILTAAGLVHHQKGEDEVCLSMLKKAHDKLGTQNSYESIDLQGVRTEIRSILNAGSPKPFEIHGATP